MSKRYLMALAILPGILMTGSAEAKANKGNEYITFKVAIYRNSKCSGKPEDAIPIETSKSCNSYSYTDSKGKLFNGSENNVRCYEDKVIYDKYPMSATCTAVESVYEGKVVLEKDHVLPVGKCTEAPSHEGPVYEKLIGYKYPGNENCKKTEVRSE